MNQLVRTTQVRAPTDPIDTLNPTDLASAATNPPNLDPYIDAIITQIRSLAGTVNWYDPPASSIAALLAALSAMTTVPCNTAVQVGQIATLDTAGVCQVSDSLNPRLAIGFVTAKPTSSTATLTTHGVINGFSGLIPGTDYFRGPAGGLVYAPFPNTVAYIQPMGVALTNTALLAQVAPQQIIRSNA